MEYIELVIKIPEYYYKAIKEISDDYSTADMLIIRNGTPLPKGHKRLIEDNFEVGPVFDEEGNRVGYRYITQEELHNALTIIEADGGNAK